MKDLEQYLFYTAVGMISVSTLVGIEFNDNNILDGVLFSSIMLLLFGVYIRIVTIKLNPKKLWGLVKWFNHLMTTIIVSSLLIKIWSTVLCL